MKSMKKRQRIETVIKWVTLICAATMVVCLLSVMIMEQVVDGSQRRNERVRNDELNGIVQYLEYTGLDEAAKEKMTSFSQRYTQYSNFIITDSSFRVLYSVNQGFLDGDDHFYVLFDAGTADAYLCDGEGNIRSQHLFYSDNQRQLQQLSKKIPNYKNLLESLSPEAGSDATAGTAQSWIVRDRGPNVYYYGSGYEYSTGDEYSQSDMGYYAITSKNLHLFFMNDYSSDIWQMRGEQQVLRMVMNVLGVLGVIALIMYWPALALWVFLNASQRDSHPALWGVLTFLTNVVGMIVYLAVRPERLQCRNCQEPLDASYVICPICGTRNRDQCVHCGKVIQEDWAHCPYCGKEQSAILNSAPEEVQVR